MLTASKAGWGRVYALLVIYGLVIACSFVAAPGDYAPRLPLAQSFAEVAAFPQRAAFALDIGALISPLVLLAFCVLAPFRLAKDVGSEVVPTTVLLFVVFGLVATPLMAWPNFTHVSIPMDGTSRLGRLMQSAASDDFSFVFVTWIYLSVLVVLGWVSYFAIPKTILTLNKAPRT